MAVGFPSERDESGHRPDSDLFLAAHVRELSSHRRPGEYTTSIQNMAWHPALEVTTSPYGLLSFPSEQLVAVWSASQGRPDIVSSRSVSTPVIHVPQCRLDVTSIGSHPFAGMVERVAINGSVVRALLAHASLPSGISVLRPHVDDSQEWVYSRCLMSDFSCLNEEEAKTLSEMGQLCCLASLVLAREGSGGEWDLFIVVHKVTAHRRPEIGSCGCE